MSILASASSTVFAPRCRVHSRRAACIASLPPLLTSSLHRLNGTYAWPPCSDKVSNRYTQEMQAKWPTCSHRMPNSLHKYPACTCRGQRGLRRVSKVPLSAPRGTTKPCLLWTGSRDHVTPPRFRMMAWRARRAWVCFLSYPHVSSIEDTCGRIRQSMECSSHSVAAPLPKDVPAFISLAHARKINEPSTEPR